MRRAALALIAPFALAASQCGGLSGPRPAEPRLQLVTVQTAGWDATDAVLRRWERADASAPWRPVGGEVRAVVGRTGLAWGRGLYFSPDSAEGPKKREGDGRAPAGMFTLGPAFGYAPSSEIGPMSVRYVATDASVECVDDSRSRFYNRLVDRDTIPAPDWTSHEEMRRSDGLYRLGLWVDHNAPSTVAGGGSCIFLHIWQAPGVPTIGCTAMDAADLEALLRWLDPRKGPALVQLPREQYAELRGRMGWP